MGRSGKISLILILILVLFFNLLIINSQNVEAANIITVGPDGPPAHNYSKIMDAISNATDGDTINVYGGTYQENIVIDKSINLVGISGSSSTSIITPDINKNTMEITANDVKITGFSIMNLGGSFACVKLISVQNSTISSNNIQNGGNGLYLIDSFNNTIDNNNVNDNNVGIYFSNADENMIKDNDIHDNNQNGIFAYSTSMSNIFHQNRFSNNLAGNAYDLGTNNWYYDSRGNYWDDYNDYDSDGDGIGDNPYHIDGSGNNLDQYPLGYFLSANQEPVAHINSINPNPAKQGDIISFVGHGSDDGSIVSWEWKSGESIIGTSGSFSTSSLSPGNHTIRFRVKDDDGEWSDYVNEILVINPNIIPTAHILKPTKSTFDYGELIEFQGYGIDPDGDIESYLWKSVPTGIHSENISFNKSDLSVGEYVIYFRVMDDKDEWSPETSINLKIMNVTSNGNLPPIANPGGPYYGHTNEPISFNGSKSYDPDQNDNLSYSWDFGDGEKGSGMNPTHSYENQGNYTVALTVVDKGGLESNTSTYANVNPRQNNEKNGNDTPGFEAFLVFLAIFVLLIARKNKKT
jgi:parallel beta-helix repeat protein